MTTDPLTVHVLVEGRVQGVGYRAWCVNEAEVRGLSGWVQNRVDGAVEAVFSGQSDTVIDMMDALWHGPSFARVKSVTNLESVDAVTGSFFVRRQA